MQNFLAGYYSWILAAHIIAVISWMAGMLYLPRLFVYHCETPPGSEGSERFKVMERRLLRGIINPAMIAVWILGLTLAWVSGMHDQTWLQLKFFLVIALSGLHGFFVRCWRDFANDRNTRTARFYRIINEVPALLMVLIVILVVVKPFSG
ncbi:MAG TPA: protoporphyrinogen oxidase HemJ [Rhizomicrobium sp.]|jgi:putative membrane protein|nr:protoporphyrinogen oxidase HemJ [Rhizomicrobium sp.]